MIDLLDWDNSMFTVTARRSYYHIEVQIVRAWLLNIYGH